MKSKVKLKGKLKFQFHFMLYIDVGVFTFNIKAGVLLTAFIFVYFISYALLYFHIKPVIMNEMVSFATQYGQIQRRLLRDLDLPHALLDDQGKVIWTNKEFEKLVHKEKGYKKSVTTLFPAMTKDRLPGRSGEAFTEMDVNFEGRDFHVKARRISLKEMVMNSDIVEAEDYDGYLIAIYLFDETALKIALREIDDQSLAVGLIYLDNYDEALESVEEVRRSLLIALIDRKVNKYISALDGISKKLEKDKYLVILRKKAVAQLKEDRFDVLEDVKTVNIGNEMAVTLSIGVGVSTVSYNQKYEYSRMAIDLALGRGGDQVVIKEGDKISYFGGKSRQVEKMTRVKARVKAHALREIFETREQIFIMGHSISDMDSFGAAVGIYCAAHVMGKKAYIVLNEVTSSLRPMKECFTEEKGYPEDLFIDSDEAIELVDYRSVVVVVDTNRPTYTECPEILRRTKSIVVFDHHRQSSEVIENAVLSYIESYASSTCEMVAEVLQYFDENIHLRPNEADCIYAGILIDTNNFMTKTGVRTFEAAAYLRRCGAEVTRVRKLLRDDMAAYKARAEAVRHAQVYRGAFAISICPADSNVESPTIAGAQAANELLNIVGIKASFVLTEYNEKIYISSRSIDEINVQLIMERMGGGGHLNVAGAQLKDCTVEQAKRKIQETLDQMLKEGDIEV